MTDQPPVVTPRNAESEVRRNHARLGLEEYERSVEGRPPWMLTMAELKLLGIAGVGFFLDAYDLFIINPVATMLQYRLYDGDPLPANLEGFVKAGANIGSVIGQFLFGYLAGALGRRRVYGKELMLIIFATILCLTTPTGSISPDGSLVYLGVFRILLGVGVGGDYPMSATVTSDRTAIRRRGALLSYIFANQGWGSLAGSVVTMIVLLCYKDVMQEGKTSKVDGAWRIVVGLSLVPAFGTLYQRLTLPEARRFEATRKAKEAEDGLVSTMEVQPSDDEPQQIKKSLDTNDKVVVADTSKSGTGTSTPTEPSSTRSPEKNGASKGERVTKEERGVGAREATHQKKSHFHDFLVYFSEWRHARILIGTCLCWFFLDIAFYGINLNQNVVLQQIGFDGKSGTPWEKLFKIATGNLIITALGFVPGYYVTVLTIEWLGRKWIQIQGFLLCALFLGILAGKFTSMGTVPFIVCFALLQFFFNFGPNTTTYCYPAEVFPTRLKAFAHGLNAACGKAGAIISALAFNTLSKKIGTPAVLWIFFACCIVGAACTLLLPEVKGRDADEIDAEEIRAGRKTEKSA